MKLNKSLYIKKKNCKLEKIKESFASFKQSERYDLISELENKELNDKVKEIYHKFSDRKYFVQIGIGGSSLGPEMLVSALKSTDREFTFINNIDPDYLKDQLDAIDFKNALFYVVSKSGGTAETVSSFAIIAKKLNELGISENEFRDYFVFATDPEESSLKNLALDLNIEYLPVPRNIGGRFCVLTPVGLLPASFAGADIDKLTLSAFHYAKELEEGVEIFDIANDILNLKEEGITQTVLMPYSSKLRDLSFWFVQLWAESLGKENIGLTPIPAYGATDQHSQMQLFMEGPRDKLLFMLNIKNSKYDFSLENNFNHPRLKMLSEYSLKNLIEAEFFGAIEALAENKRHFFQLEIDSICEKEISELIIFFEYLTVIVGKSLEIDPFNQPGVEAGKIFAFKWLEKLSEK